MQTLQKNSILYSLSEMPKNYAENKMNIILGFGRITVYKSTVQAGGEVLQTGIE